MIKAYTIVGALDVEGAELVEALGPQTESQVWLRPAGVALQNDGRWYYWLPARGDAPRQIEHDGEGWHVTCIDWTGSHVYRLADAVTGEFVDSLSVGAGERIPLDRAYRYEINHDGTRWWLVQL